MKVDFARPKKPRQPAGVPKTDRRSFRLGGGEYQRPPERVEVSVPVIRGEGEPLRIALDRGERASLQQGRKLFFAVCGQVRPEFVEGLNAAPMAALQALDQRAPGPTQICALLSERGALVGLVDKLRYIERPWQLVKFDDRYRQLREALKAWARRFKVQDNWLMDLALDRLCPPPWNEQLLFSFPAASAAPRLSLIAWDPTVETRTKARARMRGLIEQHLYCVERQAAARGLERTPERRELRHFHLLAGYQISGWSQNRIAKTLGTDRAGVVRAIHDLADFLGLRLRPATANDPSQTVEAIRTVLSRIPLAR